MPKLPFRVFNLASFIFYFFIFIFLFLFFLQIWLQEKLNLLNIPANPLNYQPHQIQSRPLKMKDKCTTDQWINWMKGVTDSEIAWVCPWWKLKYVTTELYGQCLPIPGLHHSTFISPSRLCR